MRANLPNESTTVEGWLKDTGFGRNGKNFRKCFLVEVEHRDVATLLPIIQHHKKPG